jgi:hypothetical protein
MNTTHEEDKERTPQGEGVHLELKWVMTNRLACTRAANCPAITLCRTGSQEHRARVWNEAEGGVRGGVSSVLRPLLHSGVECRLVHQQIASCTGGAGDCVSSPPHRREPHIGNEPLAASAMLSELCVSPSRTRQRPSLPGRCIHTWAAHD